MNPEILNLYLFAAVMVIGAIAVLYVMKFDAAKRHNALIDRLYDRCLLTRDRFYDERQDARAERDALALHVKNMEAVEINRLLAEIEEK